MNETQFATSIARTPEEHFRDNDYARAKTLGSRETFLASPYFARWVQEVHRAYRDALRDAGRIVSVGSGLGEHDVLLHLAGYDIVSTDLIRGVAAETQQLFPEMRFAALDLFDENGYVALDCDSILATGIDYALDDSSLKRFFAIVGKVLRSSRVRVPRFVFTIRYRDNLLTRVIDQVALPFEARLRLWMVGAGHKIVRKDHGYRRSIAEVLRFAQGAGLDLRSISYAGFGIEWERSAVVRRIPFALSTVRLLDRLTHVGCNCTVLELTI